MQSVIEVIEPPNSVALISLYELKIALGIADATQDMKLELMIDRISDEIAVLCNRQFARQRIVETFSEVGTANGQLFLTVFPATEIISINENDVDLVAADYSLNRRSGTLHRAATTWAGPVSVEYVGGYELPFEAPPALRQAALLMTREEYYAGIRGDSSIRMVAHKESRIMYHPPTVTAQGGGGGVSAVAQNRAVDALLKRYIRIWA